MNIRLILKLLGFINLFLGCMMFVPAFYSLFDNMKGILPFLEAIGICMVVSSCLYFPNRKVKGEISHREGFAIVGLVWFSASCFGALPFHINGGFGGNYTNALFESVSGFTTTGSTILLKISTLPNSILLWRSMIQWLGGMGIVLLSMAILPLLGIGGVQLFKAEVPGPTVEKISPRIKETAKLLWWVYIFITVLEVIALKIAGMSLFDSVCHSFTTMATGGFSPKDNGIMFYNSATIEIILTFFMIVAGANFSLHYLALRGKPLCYFKDEECRGYLFLLTIITGFITIMLLSKGAYNKSWSDALRHSAFQVASLMTTTGYNSENFELWRALAPSIAFILILAMFLGGMSGSTGGGIKIIRCQVLIKRTYNALIELIHPRAITKVRINEEVIPDPQVKLIGSFFVIYIVIFVLSTFCLSIMGINIVSSISAVAACLNNIGPGFDLVGPLSNFDSIPMLGKWILILNMLIGRLEVFTIALLFLPAFWKK